MKNKAKSENCDNLSVAVLPLEFSLQSTAENLPLNETQ